MDWPPGRAQGVRPVQPHHVRQGDGEQVKSGDPPTSLGDLACRKPVSHTERDLPEHHNFIDGRGPGDGDGSDAAPGARIDLDREPGLKPGGVHLEARATGREGVPLVHQPPEWIPLQPGPVQVAEMPPQ